MEGGNIYFGSQFQGISANCGARWRDTKSGRAWSLLKRVWGNRSLLGTPTRKRRIELKPEPGPEASVIHRYQPTLTH